MRCDRMCFLCPRMRALNNLGYEGTCEDYKMAAIDADTEDCAGVVTEDAVYMTQDVKELPEV